VATLAVAMLNCAVALSQRDRPVLCERFAKSPEIKANYICVLLSENDILSFGLYAGQSRRKIWECSVGWNQEVGMANQMNIHAV